jgi:hypothetical protein
MRALVFAALLIFAGSASPTPAVAGEAPQNVSIVQLLATPEKFNGKFVRVIGFLCLEFEGDAVYLHREDFVHGLTQNALWVDVPEKRDEALSQHYVLLEGTFDATSHGHMDLFGRAIKNITRMTLWSSQP